MRLPSFICLDGARTTGFRSEAANTTDSPANSPSAQEQAGPAHSANVPASSSQSGARGMATGAGSSNTVMAIRLRNQFGLLEKKLTRTALLNGPPAQAVLTDKGTVLKRSVSFHGNPTGLLESQPFNPEFLHLMESATGKASNTLKWGTPEFPRMKRGKSTIKPHEREGNVETGKPKVNPVRFFIDENQGVSRELVEAVENVRNGGRTFVFGMDMDGRFVGAPEVPVPEVQLKDDEGKPVEALLGHVALVGGEKLRISGEMAMMPCERDNPLCQSENSDKKRLVLINKSGRYGREGVRTEEQLLNVEAFIAKRGVQVDEVIFRKKKNGKATDTSLLLREAKHLQQSSSPSENHAKRENGQAGEQQTRSVKKRMVLP